MPALRRRLLQSLSQDVRNEIIQNHIEKLESSGERFELTIRRRKALLFADTGACDNEGVHTVFGQIMQEFKKNPQELKVFKTNDVDT